MIRVSYADVDRMGIVHHANYFRFFERAREEFVRRRGGSYAAMEDAGHLLPLVEVDCRYHRSVRYDDVIAVTVRIEKITYVTVTVVYEIRREGDDTTLLARGRTRHACVTRDGHPVRIPADALATFTRDEVAGMEGRRGEV